MLEIHRSPIRVNSAGLFLSRLGKHFRPPPNAESGALTGSGADLDRSHVSLKLGDPEAFAAHPQASGRGGIEIWSATRRPAARYLIDITDSEGESTEERL